MDTFSLLSTEMQRKIWDMGWTNFTPIQEQSIPMVMNTNKHLIISSGTASGKTEAAFLPILSMIGKEAKSHLKVIYISPLKALINNQFSRIEKLSEHFEINIHRWHGDVDQSKKKKFTKSPNGILQITPESLESLFINRTGNLRHIFSSVDFIVIDELHAFLDNERGVQLRSLLSRMEKYTHTKPRIIGLSATLNNFSFVQEWMDFENPSNVSVIQANNTEKELLYSLMHFPKETEGKTTIDLYQDLRELTTDNHSLIFCNSRGGVEETTVFLNRLAQKEGMTETYYAHHSSVDKKEREFVERTVANSSEPKSIVATSSLELGIDIGSIDLVVQIDSTFTVSSLKQRLGRSGRSQESSQLLQMYTTEDDGLLQALAVMELNLENWVEPSHGYADAYDILFHQILSICQETNGILMTDLLSLIKSNNAFYKLNEKRTLSLIHHMLEKETLEKIQGSNELIVGIEGERILRSKDFYAVFSSEEVFEVYEGTRKIGEFDQKFKLDVGDHVMLTGKLWKVLDVDYAKNKIYVHKAKDAKKPKYYGGPSNLHPRIVEKMFEVLTANSTYDYINKVAQESLDDSRKPYLLHEIKSNDRVIWKEKEEYLFEIFSGSKIINTLILMFRSMDVITKKPDDFGRIYIPMEHNVLSALDEMKTREWHINDLIPFILPEEILITKYSECLNDDLRIQMHTSHYLDLKGTSEYLQKFNFKLIDL